MRANELWPGMLSRGLVGKEVRFSDTVPGAIPIAQATRFHKLVDITAEDSRDARPLTLQVFSDDESAAPAGFTALPFGSPGGWLARLEWGTDSFSSEAEFHVGAGAQLTVSGASARLSVRWDDEVHALSAIGAPHVVGAQVGVGCRPSFNSPLELARSWYTGPSTPINAEPFPLSSVKIPRFARSVRVGAVMISGGTADTGELQIVFRDSRGRSIHSERFQFNVEPAAGTIVAFSDTGPDTVAIPPGAVWLGAAIIDIAPASGVSLEGAFARFEISI